MPGLAASPDRGPFRRLIEGDIGVDEYVKSLDERVREREGDHARPAPPPAPTEREERAG